MIFYDGGAVDLSVRVVDRADARQGDGVGHGRVCGVVAREGLVERAERLVVRAEVAVDAADECQHLGHPAGVACLAGGVLLALARQGG